jgi:hypothetical protein
MSIRHQNILTKQDIKEEIAIIRGDLEELGPDDDLEAEADRLQEVLDAVSWNEDPEFIDEEFFDSGKYAEQYAKGFGPTTGWPYDYIDWERAASVLRIDYRAVEIDGVTYLVRG